MQKNPKWPQIRPKLTKKALEGDVSWRKTTLNESKRRKSRLELNHNNLKQTNQRERRPQLTQNELKQAKTSQKEN